MTILTIANERLTAGISPQGGLVTHGATRAGLPFLRPLQGAVSPRRSSSFPLLPIGNRVSGNRFSHAGREYQLLANDIEPFYLHGDGWLSDWKVEDAVADRVRLSLDLDDPQYGPHRYRAAQVFAVEGDALRMTISVENTGPEPLPFGIGLHPYFPNDGAEIAFVAPAFWTEGPGHIPQDRLAVPAEVDFARPRPLHDLALNNAYEGWDGHARIRWPNGLAVEMAADPVFSTLMVYAPAADRSFFCLEPMSHLPDALTQHGSAGMHVLAPGEGLAGTVTITLLDDPR